MQRRFRSIDRAIMTCRIFGWLGIVCATVMALTFVLVWLGTPEPEAPAEWLVLSALFGVPAGVTLWCGELLERGHHWPILILVTLHAMPLLVLLTEARFVVACAWPVWFGMAAVLLTAVPDVLRRWRPSRQPPPPGGFPVVPLGYVAPPTVDMVVPPRPARKAPGRR